MDTTLPDIRRLDAIPDATLDALRARFTAVGFAEEVLSDGEAIAPGVFDALRLALVHAEFHRAPTPARDLALLFQYDAAVPVARATAALGDALLAALSDAALLVHDGDTVRSPFRITPLFGVWVLSDDLHRGEEAVMGPGPTTQRLAQALPRHCPPRVLDLCCGAGTFALLAARAGATDVTGLDISPRAVALARFNARLNGVAATFATSDLFEAVRGRRFDLVASQPAFIARPPDVTASTFAHGGAFGDELVMALFEALPTYLAPGGRALVLMESATRPGAPLHARVRKALGDAPLDLLVLASKGNSPDAYSVGYASLLDPTFGARWREVVVRYRAHLRAMGVEEFAYALAVVTAPGDDDREGDARYTITLPAQGLRGIDQEVLAGLQNALALASRDDDALLAATVRATPGATYIEERPRPDPSLQPRWVVRFTRAAFADRELTEPTWVLLGILDSAATVADAVEGFAEACGASPHEVRAQVLSFVRESLARGLLVPA